MATGDRVLPWRRQAAAPSDELAPLLVAYRSRHPKASVSLINRAYLTARRAHQHQVRGSGESYINHPIAVAKIVADIGLDDVSLAAALLHDAVEDTEITLNEVEAEFGSEVASIVDGVTKLERLQFDSKEAQQAATMRKMLVAMAKDIRVLVIKLADRLHNMRTIAGMPVEKQQRIAHETLDIYAPLAHRLGMQEIKQQLEDLSFSAIYPKRFAELDHLVATRSPERDVYLAKTIGEVQSRLGELNVRADVTGRGKHLWSIYEKMVEKGREFDEIFDLVAIRIIVDSVKDCYAALGCIHGRWKPVVGRFKDYIAMPKFNLYQSLHTTVIGPEGKPLEVQIRTREMHNRAEWGVAAHYSYKDGSAPGDIDWLNRIIETQADILDPTQFMEGLKADLVQDELFVFTPKGDVVPLPLDSTPVDFAYAVHTEVGHACVGAKVNGRLVTLNHLLRSGDTCEIFTAKNVDAGPSRDWLDFVASPRARNKIRQWFSREHRDEMIDTGRDELTAAFRRAGLALGGIWASDALAAVIDEHGHKDLDSFLAEIGEGTVLSSDVARRVIETLSGEDHPEHMAGGLRIDRPQRVGGGTIRVEGTDDVIVRLSTCCTPVPGDEVTGFLTKERGVAVHRSDCPEAASLVRHPTNRIVDVEWAESGGLATFRASVEVAALDRTRLLRDVANALSDQHVNIVACSTVTGADRVARMRFDFELANAAHLDSVMRTIKNIDAVFEVRSVGESLNSGPNPRGDD
ncbi:MAG: bifunctional (p)ppGpp synthetase/guanosine-3',5'-bis(diphosphate) 3'-pyrophosphohydrolase [Ilumatobacteraceae bacterium]|nr:bifunctional (p)ppGpp synthetase/guanosine-3',5'-bis(diphosphate) 3'-pyrophosphohydrolase [Ilumatobacteraceae bacterium]